MKIQIITGSTREGRATNQVSAWVEKTARATQPEVTWEVVDLASFDLPIFNESISPQYNQDRQLTGGVKDWVEKVGQADAYVFVTPEYNHGVPGSLKNAIDFLDYQLKRKPVAIVSHGVVGGARANEQLRLVLNSTLGALPISESVTLTGMVAMGHVFNEDGTLNEAHAGAQQAGESMLESLVWLAQKLGA